MSSWFSGYKFIDRNEDQWQSLWRGAISEFVALLVFVFIGTGSVIGTKATLGVSAISVASLTVIALAHGFTITVLVYTIGDVSGGHINPAVTWAVFVTRRISFVRAIVYFFAQLLGAIIGSALLKSILPLKFQFGMGCHGLNPELTAGQGFWAEVIFTFIFIFVVFATAVSPFAGKLTPLSQGAGGEYGPGKLTPFAVGATILVLHLVGVPLTGASMNPARSFGPAVVRGIWANHWIYWIGPLVGSTFAAFIAQAIFLSDPGTMVKVFKATRGGPEQRRRDQLQVTASTDKPASHSTSTTPKGRTSQPQTEVSVGVNLAHTDEEIELEL